MCKTAEAASKSKLAALQKMEYIVAQRIVLVFCAATLFKQDALVIV